MKGKDEFATSHSEIVHSLSSPEPQPNVITTNENNKNPLVTLAQQWCLMKNFDAPIPIATGDEFILLAKEDNKSAYLMLIKAKTKIIPLLSFKHLMELFNVNNSLATTLLRLKNISLFSTFAEFIEFLIIDQEYGTHYASKIVLNERKHFANLLTTKSEFIALLSSNESLARELMISDSGLFRRLFTTTDDCIELVRHYQYSLSILLHPDIKPTVISLFQDKTQREKLAQTSLEGQIIEMELFNALKIALTKSVRHNKAKMPSPTMHQSTLLKQKENLQIEVKSPQKSTLALLAPKIEVESQRNDQAPVHRSVNEEKLNNNIVRLKNTFFQAHEAKLTADKSSWCGLYGFFAKSYVNRNMSLPELIQHAQGLSRKGSGKRSQEVMKEIGWLDEDNQINGEIRQLLGM